MTDDDKYLGLLGARERLCTIQTHLTDPDERQALDKAVEAIDYVGSTLPAWSQFDRTHEAGTTYPLRPWPGSVTP